MEGCARIRSYAFARAGGGGAEKNLPDGGPRRRGAPVGDSPHCAMAGRRVRPPPPPQAGGTLVVRAGASPGGTPRRNGG